jgi:hypothetical protein
MFFKPALLLRFPGPTHVSQKRTSLSYVFVDEKVWLSRYVSVKENSFLAFSRNGGITMAAYFAGFYRHPRSAMLVSALEHIFTSIWSLPYSGKIDPGIFHSAN